MAVFTLREPGVPSLWDCFHRLLGAGSVASAEPIIDGHPGSEPRECDHLYQQWSVNALSIGSKKGTEKGTHYLLGYDGLQNIDRED